ncbi:hypothetical protein PPL_01917 [Heterostelium album PN500]|uniref:F-box domain-containing protein n=1 Tax=Heterostelium pallidum (strain ATCC 26659 / Pp 5 / PN500) TaxID=670386 RepID=D3B0V0_HETP5|nr:hypothetical protein PPL_01917 [Heterostelium album PN500]EFA84924.1 hypothetical protein PPL_01917 [Heterostelium album PN500]|eukprot:XP_020437034.1 hypothetical protein PPL_01917 [Heterostelium album PN500]
MVKYSLKHSGLKKDMLVDAIIKHQEHRDELKSKLVTDNSIEQYHRGTVEYRLPTLIIYRIIRDLWHDDINLNLNTLHLCRNYRWLLSIGLVSKELFKLISSLFTRFELISTYQIYESHRMPDVLAKEIKSHYLNPLSVVKNISHLTLSMEIFKEINNKSKSTSIELGVIFNNVRKLNYSSDLISSSLRKLKLPHSPFSRSFLSILPSDSQVTTFSLAYISLEQINMIGSNFKNITKLILWKINGNAESKLEELLCSPKCNVRTLYFDCRDRFQMLLHRVLPVNQSIETIDVGENLKETFCVASKSSSINRFIFHEHREQSNAYSRIFQPTGYIHIKSKYRKNPGTLFSVGAVMKYAKKIYNVSENTDDNQAIESDYPNLKFLSYVQ